MVNRAGNKGRAGENPVVAFLAANGWPYAERRRLTGVRDKGDVTGTPGLCWEIKNRRGLDLPSALRETEVERFNSDATYGLLVVKPIGMGDTQIAKWPVVMPLAKIVQLLREAGYGS